MNQKKLSFLLLETTTIMALHDGFINARRARSFRVPSLAYNFNLEEAMGTGRH
jgi:hypothetical protein